jgi:DNA-binding NtrC family response regulator
MLAAKHRRKSMDVSREAMATLMAADWKGNVRELKNVLESAVVMSRDDVIQPKDFPLEFPGMPLPASPVAGAGDVLRADDYREAKRQFEIAYIKGKLRQHGGNITRTAAAIGLHRQSLQEKLRELGIHAEKE